MTYLDKISCEIDRLPDIPMPPEGYDNWNMVPEGSKIYLLAGFRRAVEPIRQKPKNDVQCVYCDLLYKEGLITKPPRAGILKRFFMSLLGVVG